MARRRSLQQVCRIRARATGSKQAFLLFRGTGLKYTDISVVNGETYLYTGTAVESSGVESLHSAPATAVIP